MCMCGDWVERCNDDDNEGSNGHSSWSTEKSVVTGRQAARALCRKWNLEHFDHVMPVIEQDNMKQIRNIANVFSNILP